KYGNFEGRLAEKWDVAKDRMSVTFTMRKGVKWHDGSPLTADDVIFTVKAAQNAKTIFFQKPSFDYIKDIKKVGDDQVFFEFNMPLTNPLTKFSWKVLPKSKFASEALLPTDAFASSPVGSGPFQVVQATGKQVKFNRFKDYCRPATVDGVFMQQIPDRNNQLELLQLGGLDAVIIVRPRDVPELERVRSVKLYPYSTVNWWYIAYNFGNPHLAEAEVREAITFALNRIDLLMAHLGTGDILSGPFTQASPFYNWEVKPRPYDPKRAASLLEGLGYQKKGAFYQKDGKPLSFTLLVEKGGQEIRGLCLDIQSQLKQVGIKLDVKFEDSAKFNELVFKQNKFDMVLHMWSFKRFENLYPLFHTSGDRNFVGYSNPTVDTLLDRSRQARDAESLRKFYQGLHKELARDLPYTFLWSLNARTAIASKYRNVYITPHYYFSTIYEWSLK
ncbi:MAG: hypothetical protein FJ125_02800, partial [Deltaproteobacteria bacterium]|nr:hypothetical protein [Deltaproteobacteria bacterium]